MADFGDKIQALMDEFYDVWKKEENKGKSKWDVLEGLSSAHQIAVVFGNFNYQVENGGLEQWVYNGYFHDDAEKLIEYLEDGKEIDERCSEILDKVYMLDKYARETECDKDGYYYDPDNDGDSSFIGEMVNCETFDTWYYNNCDKDDWWKTVCGIIEKVTGHDFALGEDAAPSHPIRVYIENIHDDRIGGFTMPLPATPEEMKPFLEGAEITGWWDMKIWEVLSDDGRVYEKITEVMQNTMSQNAFNELNYLAAKINSLGEYGCDIFAAVIEAGKNCETLREMINLTFPENINRFDLLPAFTNEQYGDFLIEQVGVDAHANAFNRLENSAEPEDNELAKYIEKLEKYVDTEKYGRDAIKEENGVLTNGGLLMGGDGIQEIYRGPEDIPAEYRVFAEQTEKPLVKVENTDITAMLMKLYAVCGDPMVGGEAYRLNPFINGKDTDYLLMIDGSKTNLSPAVDAYKRGNYVFDTVAEWSQKPDARFFAIHVTGRSKDGESGIIGDFIELNRKALDSSITHHSISPDRIDATMTDGSKRSFDLWSWADMPIPYRGNIVSSEKHFAENDIQTAFRSFEKYRDESASECRVVSTADLLCDMNSAYMNAAQNPQPDMLRITNEAARQVLARGDAEVYLLTPKGAEKLDPIEAMRPLCFAEHQELAVKREDAGSLDKWAGRAAQKLLRQNEREKRDKSKTKGEEL